jgi:hypothetical protein
VGRAWEIGLPDAQVDDRSARRLERLGARQDREALSVPILEIAAAVCI